MSLSHIYGLKQSKKLVSIHNNLIKHLNPFLSNNYFKHPHRNYPKIRNSDNAQETPHHASLKASFTIEASIVLPLFVGFIAFMLYFMRIVMVEEGVQQALNKSVREVAAATTNYSDHSGVATTSAAIAKTHLHLSGDPFVEKFVTLGSWAIIYSDDDYSDNYVTIVANYSIKFPIGFFGRINTHVTQSARSRMWIGDDPSEGGVYKKEASDKESELVYVAETGVVYHNSRECAYLDLNIKMIPSSAVSGERNSSGHIYYPCSKCHPVKGASDYLYITTYGTVYHNSLSCSGIKRTVYRIEKEEATSSGKGGCSKCVK